MCIGSAVELSLLHCELEGNVVADTKGGAGNEGSTKWQEFVSLFEKGIEKFDEEITAAIAHPLYSIAAQSNTDFSLVRKVPYSIIARLASDLLSPKRTYGVN